MSVSIAVLRLGKDSVSDIQALDALHAPPANAVPLTVTCKQVPGEATKGTYVLIWLGSDNSKGQSTDWKQGVRAIGRIEGKSGGPTYNDDWIVEVSVAVVLPQSVSKEELLASAPNAYYWAASVPIIGISSFSNQTVQLVHEGAPLQDSRAVLYALDAASPGLKSTIRDKYPELSPLLVYTPPQPGTGTAVVSPTSEATQSDGGPGVPEGLSAEWVIALASKGLLLAAGPSGTGKSRTGRDIARALDYDLPSQYAETLRASRPATCLAFVPVGADWIDDTPLLGFRNYFGSTSAEEAGSGEVWDAPSTLRLLLRALARPDQAHFLVLDEMNLSHVERYFGRFLSVMEGDRGLDRGSKMALLSPDEVALVSATLSDRGVAPLEAEVASELADGGQALHLPDNLFIVGTVNVDETTYMFSPKVLDRSHVLEMQAPDPAAYLAGTASEQEELLTLDVCHAVFRRAIERRRNGYWERLTPAEVLEQAASAGWSGSEDEILQTVKNTLAGLYKLLSPIGFAFGPRVINEVAAYLATYLELDSPGLFKAGADVGWKGALDRAVLQKVLPKIHGNRRLLGESLTAVADFLDGKPCSYLLGLEAVEVGQEAALGFSLTKSADRTRAMHARLEASGHTSFLE